MKSSTADAAETVRAARTHLRDTLSALGDHLTPGGALDAARALVDDTETRREAIDFVKRHPVPTALAGLGLAWLGYTLLSGGDDAPDPRAEPGLTEVPGRRVAAPPEPATGRRDVPRVELPARAPGGDGSGPVLARIEALRATFARHPLLYGVVGLVAGAVMGVVAAVRRGAGGDEATPSPDPREPARAATTCAAGGSRPVTPSRRPMRPEAN